MRLRDMEQPNLNMADTIELNLFCSFSRQDVLSLLKLFYVHISIRIYYHDWYASCFKMSLFWCFTQSDLNWSFTGALWPSEFHLGSSLESDVSNISRNKLVKRTNFQPEHSPNICSTIRQRLEVLFVVFMMTVKGLRPCLIFSYLFWISVKQKYQKHEINHKTK